MSFLLVKGEQIHSKLFNISKIVEYENAPLSLQICDIIVLEQKMLYAVYCEQLVSSVYEEAQYYHEIGICESCFQKLHKDAYYIPDEDTILNKILDE